MRRAPMLLATLALLAVPGLASCGGGTRTVTVARHVGPPAPAKVAACHTMSCVLATQPPPNVGATPKTAPTVYGLDFAYGNISAIAARDQGAKFGVSYLSNDPGKNWPRSLIDSYHAAGLATSAGWESTATRSLQGCAAGASDARQASAQLAALGAPAGQPFWMAIDFDASGPDVAAYFHCASQAEPGRVNAYGGYRPLLYLHEHGDVGNLNFQSYAWSGGLWLPASIAPLEQYLNGQAFDHDRAIAANYGQWPYQATKPKPTIHSKAFKVYPLRRFKINHTMVSERRTVVRWRAERCRNPVERKVCRVTRVHLEWLAGRLSTLAHTRPGRIDWRPFHWGIRHYRIERILNQRNHRTG